MFLSLGFIFSVVALHREYLKTWHARSELLTLLTSYREIHQEILLAAPIVHGVGKGKKKATHLAERVYDYQSRRTAWDVET